MVDTYVNKIVDKLKVNNIKKIVSIDNEWKPKQDEVDLGENLRNFIDKKGINITGDIETELSNDAEIETIQDLIKSDNKELQELKQEVEKHLNKKTELSPALQSLEKLLCDINDICSEIEVIKKYDSDVDFTQYKENCLFILDKNMGSGKADIIINSIFKINNCGKEKDDIILIYTYESITEYQTNQSKTNYLNNNNDIDDNDKKLLVYKMWAIGKRNKFEELLPEVYDMLLKSMYGNALYNIIQHKMKIEEIVYNKLIEIDTKDVTYSITDSFIEGDNIIQSLDRLYSSIKNKTEYDNIDDLYMKSIQCLISYEREKVNALINEIEGYRKLRNDHTIHKLKTCQANFSYHAIFDYSLNKYYSDVSTGDIFKFKTYNNDNWMYGMLISQACNCVIRIPGNDINEVGRAAEQMQLLIFKGELIKDTYSKDDLKVIRDCIWPILIDDKPFILQPTDNTIIIPSQVLDLCSLNNDGNANMNFDFDTIEKYKTYHSLKYYSNFKEKYFGDNFKSDGEIIINKFENIVKDLYSEVSKEIACSSDCAFNNGIEEATKKFRKEIFEKTISLKYNICFKDDAFDLQRIGRLEPKRTLIIIQDFVHNLSKAGADPIPAN